MTLEWGMHTLENDASLAVAEENPALSEALKSHPVSRLMVVRLEGGEE
jgi:hypothetical protein